MPAREFKLSEFGLLGGRFKANGPNSGEALRDDHLIPLLADDNVVVINLDDGLGMPPSATEEAFGGLVRKLGPSVLNRLIFQGREDWVARAKRVMREEAARAQ